jgi:transposase
MKNRLVTIKCAECGKETMHNVTWYLRKYCSNECCVKHKRRDEVAEIRRIAAEKKGSGADERVDEFVISLWLAGYSRAAIAEAFGMKYATLKTWISKHNNPERRYIYYYPFEGARAPIDYAYKYARTAEEWVLALRDKARGYPREGSGIVDNRPVYLMCGSINAGKNSASLCDIVKLKLGMNPLEGGIFAFCGIRQQIIQCIFNDGRGLCSLEYRRLSGTYPWPSPELGAAILVTSEDFELMLCIGNRYRNKLSWDDFDLLE